MNKEINKIKTDLDSKISQTKEKIKIEKIKQKVTINSEDIIENFFDSISIAINETKKTMAKEQIDKKSKEYSRSLINISTTFLKTLNNSLIKTNSKTKKGK